MAESRRLNGLKKLREFGLPTPAWQEVKSTADISQLHLADTPYGWTIRTCRNDGQRETGGFFKNNLSSQGVLTVLRGRVPMFEKGEFYIVYPSWKFDMSFNVIFDDATFTVEGKLGSQKGISDGTELPEISLRIPNGMHSRTVVYLGRYELAIRGRVSRILSYLRRIPLPRYYIEVAITSDRQIFFYELFPIGS